jgi:transposase
MQDAAHTLTKQFLAWVAEAPRSYADADAWRRSCPHLSVWEDAIANGLIQFKNGSTMKDSQILLTGRGRSFLKLN